VRHTLLPLLVVVLLAQAAPAAVFQYAVPVNTRQGESTAYLWIPPEAEQVRGVVIGGMTLAERELAQDPRIRRACADEQLAIVFLKCGLNATDLQAALAGLAKVSGYRELAVAPLLFFGHSAGGPQARQRARQFADRCFGLVQYRGADPGGQEPVAAGIPALMMIGQFDEFGKIGRDENGVENWEKDRDKLVAFRAADECHLGSIAVEPGGGHFAWSDRNAEYLALFIRKAAKARIPESWPIDSDKPIALNTVDPRSGWLTDATIKSAGKCKPAPYGEYEGDKSSGAWHFDREMAEATVAYHAGIGRRDQFIKWSDPHSVQAGARNFFSRVQWTGDGQSFVVHPVYAATYPSGSGARWGEGGKPVGHAAAPIRVKQVSGPILVTGEHTFRIRFDELAPATEAARVTFIAYSEGDADYRYTERVGMIAGEQATLTAGKVQSIDFPALRNLNNAADALELRATSDAGLPVEFHVAYGPAAVVDGKLKAADVPKRAKFPLAVNVVAYQFGRGVEPFVRTAMPVVQAVHIEGP
jgi:hypothetical protein